MYVRMYTCTHYIGGCRSNRFDVIQDIQVSIHNGVAAFQYLQTVWDMTTEVF